MPRSHSNLVEFSDSILPDYSKNRAYITRRQNVSAIKPSNPRDWVLDKGFSPRIDPIEREDSEIESEIHSAALILAIGNELDDPSFTPYTKDTLDRASNFLRRLALHAHSCGFSGIGTPEILPAERGSIDLLWRSPGRKLLMNFPSDPMALISFYGKKGTSELSGRFHIHERRPELVYWLVE
jgi:hypothetical protein